MEIKDKSLSIIKKLDWIFGLGVLLIILGMKTIYSGVLYQVVSIGDYKYLVGGVIVVFGVFVLSLWHKYSFK